MTVHSFNNIFDANNEFKQELFIIRQNSLSTNSHDAAQQTSHTYQSPVPVIAPEPVIDIPAHPLKPSDRVPDNKPPRQAVS